MKLKNANELIRLLSLLLIVVGFLAFAKMNMRENISKVRGEATCPDGGYWTKIDSSDLSLYPVDEATEYCFKAGSTSSQGCTGGIFSEIPENGFGQITDEVKYCGLSHWSYKIDDGETTPTPTPTTETTNTPTPTPETTNTPTPTPTDEPTVTPTDEPTPSSTPAPTDEPQATDAPQPTDAPKEEEKQTETSEEPAVGGIVTPSGEILGAYAATGVTEDILMTFLGLSGSGMTVAGYMLHDKKKKK